MAERMELEHQRDGREGRDAWRAVPELDNK